MKQKDIPGIGAQQTVPSVAREAGAKPGTNGAHGANGATLQSAQPVVTPARKKPAARAEIGRPRDEGPDATLQTPDLPRSEGAPDVISPPPPPLPDVPSRVPPQAKPGLRGAVVFDTTDKVDKGNELAPDKPQGRRQQTKPEPEPAIDALPPAEDTAEPAPPATAGINDRVPWLAMAAVTPPLTLRPPTMAKTRTSKPLRPTSRAECRRRCGKNGMCDPSSEFGCGGVYCGQKHDGV